MGVVADENPLDETGCENPSFIGYHHRSQLLSADGACPFVSGGVSRHPAGTRSYAFPGLTMGDRVSVRRFTFSLKQSISVFHRFTFSLIFNHTTTSTGRAGGVSSRVGEWDEVVLDVLLARVIVQVG